MDIQTIELKEHIRETIILEGKHAEELTGAMDIINDFGNKIVKQGLNELKEINIIINYINEFDPSELTQGVQKKLSELFDLTQSSKDIILELADKCDEYFKPKVEETNKRTLELTKQLKELSTI